jgi:hypothetical protein
VLMLGPIALLIGIPRQKGIAMTATESE